jgi:hypothetical protein
MSRKFLFAAVATAFSVFSVAAVPSASAGIIITNVQVPYYEAFTLKSTASSPINGSSTLNLFKAVGNTEVVGIAGQIILTSNVGLLGVWCVDLFRNISLGGTYTYDEGAFTTNNSAPPVAPTALTATQIDDIGKLAAYGNFLMSTAPTNAKSAAIQAAIWNVEYGTTASGSAAFNTELANVMTVLGSNTLTNPGGVALFSQKDSQGLFTTQIYYKPNSVPEPSTLIIMAFALLSLMGLGALRQKASA